MASSSQLVLPNIQANALKHTNKPPLIPNYHYRRNPDINPGNHNNSNNLSKSTNYPYLKQNSRSQSASSNSTTVDYNNKIPNNQLYLSNEFMSRSMLKQFNNERMYIDTVLSKNQNKLQNENDSIRNEFTKQQQYNDYLDCKRVKEKSQIVSLNKEILEMQIKQKRLLSFQKKKERSSSMSKFRERINRENVIYELEKSKNDRINHFYKKELESQIVLQLIQKIEKDDMSNRSRIRNRLLVNDYINTLNKDDNGSNIYI